MTEYLLSIDPGYSSAIVLLSYEKDTTPKLEYATQFEGGAEAVDSWVSRVQVEPHTGMNLFDLAWVEPEEVICEAFTARRNENFGYTTRSLEALPVIGVLVSRGLVDRADKKRYRDPKYQYLVGGDSLEAKRKRQHRFLEDSGYLIDRKVIGTTLKDYNDARSACAHGLAYLARELKHKKTFELIQGWVDGH